MKVKTLLVAAVMFVALSAAAFAQATFTVGSIPVTTVTASGNAEKTGDITFTLVQGSSPTVSGTVTISYGVPMTSPIGFIHVIAPLAVAPAVNNFVGTALQVLSINAQAGQVVIAVPAGVAAPGSFTLTGVRVAVAGTSLSSLSAAISSTGNAIVAGQTGVTVINSIAAGLAKVGVDPATGKAFADAPELVAINPESSTSAMFASENYLDAFGSIPSLDTTITTGIIVRFTLSANPPAGVSIVFPTSATHTGTNSTAEWTLCDSTGKALGATQTIKSDTVDLHVYYALTSSSNPTAIDDISVEGVAINVASSATLPLPSGTITYVASLAPIQPAFNTDGTVTNLPIPRFAAADVGTGTLFSIAGSTTTLLVPYAVTMTAAGYNTGFAIANTTVDPAEEAIPQVGTITFTLYQQQSGSTAPTSYTYTTQATSPGTGLDATGKLPGGSLYTVLLSEILSAAGAPPDFSGYVFIECNFTNAHALATISDFTGYTSGSYALVVLPDRTGGDAGAENLNN